jgi:hypothetical protein
VHTYIHTHIHTYTQWLTLIADGFIDTYIHTHTHTHTYIQQLTLIADGFLGAGGFTGLGGEIAARYFAANLLTIVSGLVRFQAASNSVSVMIFRSVTPPMMIIRTMSMSRMFIRTMRLRHLEEYVRMYDTYVGRGLRGFAYLTF